jgi:hypothetical protein
VFQAVLKRTTEMGIPLHAVAVDAPYDYVTGHHPNSCLPDPTKVDWMGRVRDLEDLVHGRGLEFCLIINSETPGTSEDDRKYYEETLRYMDAYRARGGHPDHWIVESWYPNPKRIVPESEPYTFACLVKAAMEKAHDDGKEMLKAKPTNVFGTVIDTCSFGVRCDGSDDSAALLSAAAAANALAPKPAVLLLAGGKLVYNPKDGTPIIVGPNVSVQMPGAMIVGGPHATDAFVYAASNQLPQALPTINNFARGAAVHIKANGIHATFSYFSGNKYGIWVQANNRMGNHGLYNCSLTGMKIAGGDSAIRLTVDEADTVIQGITVRMNFCQSPKAVRFDTVSPTPIKAVINDNKFEIDGIDPVQLPDSWGVWVDPNLAGSVLGPNILIADEFFGGYASGPFHFIPGCTGWTLKLGISCGETDTWEHWPGFPANTLIIDSNTHEPIVKASMRPDPTGNGPRREWHAKPYFTNNIGVILPIDKETAHRLNAGKVVDYYVWSPFTKAGLDVIKSTPAFCSPLVLLAVEDESRTAGIDGNCGPNQIHIRIAALPGGTIVPDRSRANTVHLQWGY